jgi:hypothetical protein
LYKFLGPAVATGGQKKSTSIDVAPLTLLKSKLKLALCLLPHHIITFSYHKWMPYVNQVLGILLPSFIRKEKFPTTYVITDGSASFNRPLHTPVLQLHVE